MEKQLELKNKKIQTARVVPADGKLSSTLIMAAKMVAILETNLVQKNDVYNVTVNTDKDQRWSAQIYYLSAEKFEFPPMFAY